MVAEAVALTMFLMFLSFSVVFFVDCTNYPSQTKPKALCY